MGGILAMTIHTLPQVDHGLNIINDDARVGYSFKLRKDETTRRGMRL